MSAFSARSGSNDASTGGSVGKATRMVPASGVPNTMVRPSISTIMPEGISVGVGDGAGVAVGKGVGEGEADISGEAGVSVCACGEA